MQHNPFESFNRWMDDEPLEYPTAVVKLVDALRDYLRADVCLADELLQEQAITLEQYDKGMAELEDVRELLRKFEEYGTCCNLYGLIKVKR